jgi:hypothetical protein
MPKQPNKGTIENKPKKVHMCEEQKKNPTKRKHTKPCRFVGSNGPSRAPLFEKDLRMLPC